MFFFFLLFSEKNELVTAKTEKRNIKYKIKADFRFRFMSHGDRIFILIENASNEIV